MLKSCPHVQDVSYIKTDLITRHLPPVQDDKAAGAGGQPSVDYPTYNEVPVGLSFSCSDKLPGYYADPAAQCQVSCLLLQDETRQISQFLTFTYLEKKRFFSCPDNPGRLLNLATSVFNSTRILSRGGVMLTTHLLLEQRLRMSKVYYYSPFMPSWIKQGQIHQHHFLSRGTRWGSWLRHCATSRKVAG
jgi:hypothetical protein